MPRHPLFFWPPISEETSHNILLEFIYNFTRERERERETGVSYTSIIDLQISTGKDDPALEIASFSISKATVSNSLELLSVDNPTLISVDFSLHIE